VKTNAQRNSIKQKAQNVRYFQDMPQPPGNLPALNEDERMIWDKYMNARTQWRDYDFYRVYELVKLDVRIIEVQIKLLAADNTVITAQGTEVVNPIFSVMNHLRSHRKELWKFLMLDVPQEDAKRYTLVNHRKSTEQKRTFREKSEDEKRMKDREAEFPADEDGNRPYDPQWFNDDKDEDDLNDLLC